MINICMHENQKGMRATGYGPYKKCMDCGKELHKSRSKKVRYNDVGVFVHAPLLSRVQQMTVDVELTEEEIAELTNPEIVEFVADTKPTKTRT